jgi:copper(I)-binding protein
MIRLIVLALGLVAGILAAHAQTPSEVKAGALVVREPWSRATPGGAQVGAGYLVVENKGSTADRLLGAETDVAGSASMHQAMIADGIASMKSVESLAIPPGGRLELKPGAHHLMLENLKRPLKQGERFNGVLIFEKAGRIPVVFAVRSLGAGVAHHPQSHQPQ